MGTEITAQVLADGVIALDWRSSLRTRLWYLLIVRTGGVPAYTSIQLSGQVQQYQVNNLSRHQRYQVAVMGIAKDRVQLSQWLYVTPRAGLSVLPSQQQGLAPYLAGVNGVTVMPQDKRLTVYWGVTPGFVEKTVLCVRKGQRQLKKIELEPEVTNISLDASRGFKLVNGSVYGITLAARFATQLQQETAPVLCVPAAQGEERRANGEYAQHSLVFPSLSLAPEVDIFGQDTEPSESAEPSIACCHCAKPVTWSSYRLFCSGCRTEFIPNGRGEYLEVNRLRFGTCTCCLPKHILIQRAHSSALYCAHSGKEHIQLEKGRGFLLIEDLPFGLCQCCRPRRHLLRKDGAVVCSRTGEKHSNIKGRYVLEPSQPVFDAAAIDSLLDAGLAEICATGVSSSRH